MSPETTRPTGFAPRSSERARGRLSHMVVELIATAALVVSIMVAMTAVSMGIARTTCPAVVTISLGHTG
jgi:hypothetical protein